MELRTTVTVVVTYMSSITWS